MNKKKIVFLTGTRADFGKLKSLIKITQDSDLFEVHIFVTGMHLNAKYGKTVDEIVKSGFQNIFMFINHDHTEFMDRKLAKTVDGFSHYVSELNPDLIVVHGDRVEALAGAIVGSMNNILVAHIEGGEVSGTIDELIRHSVSKLSHIHLVANDEAKKCLIQLGEVVDSIHVIGSPDLDIMLSSKLEDINFVKSYYNILFENYAIFMFHPVTTEIDSFEEYANNVINAIVNSNKNYIVIYPNNDLGSDLILKQFKKLSDKGRFSIFPSIRFEYFLVLLKNAEFIIGNSSAGVREAPYYVVPTIDIGSRQQNRVKNKSILNVGYDENEILNLINSITNFDRKVINHDQINFGLGNSAELFYNLLKSSEIWLKSRQKQFQRISTHY